MIRPGEIYMADLAPFLRALAAGEDAAVPEGLPGELRQMLEGLLAAVADAR